MEILCEYAIPNYEPAILVLCGAFIVLSLAGSIFCFLDFYLDHEYMMLFFWYCSGGIGGTFSYWGY